MVSVVATAGNTAGDLIITATVFGVAPATFYLTVIPINVSTPAPPAPPAAPTLGSITKISGDSQVTWKGTPCNDQFIVRVLDTNGNAMPNYPVYWDIISAAKAGISPANPVGTDFNGYSKVNVVGGNGGGDVIITATAGNHTPIYFHLIVSTGVPPVFVLPDAPVAIVTAHIRSGNNQNAAPNTQFTQRLSVAILDSDTFLPIQNERVQWSVKVGDAILGNTITVSGADGLSEILVTAGGLVGNLSIVAHPMSRSFIDWHDAVFTLTVDN
jgi:hypothetical protein